MSHTKRSHYIPQCYSKNFCIEGLNPPLGFLYSKQLPSKVTKVSPKNFGVINNDLTFIKKDGTIDKLTFESIYGDIESKWPSLVEKFNNQKKLDSESLTDFYNFLSIMVIRVPNFRLRVESHRAKEAKALLKFAASHPSIFLKDINIDNNLRQEGAVKVKEGAFDIVVHPQESLKHLDIFIRSLIKEFQKLKWIILRTPDEGQKFITTDNPVIWHDFVRTENTTKFMPYAGGLNSKYIEVIFPITKNIIAIGSKAYPTPLTLSYQTIDSKSFIRKVNRYLVISSEKFIFSDQDNLIKLLQNNSRLVPVIRYVEVPSKTGERVYSYIEPDLGSHHNLPKWTQEDEDMVNSYYKE